MSAEDLIRPSGERWAEEYKASRLRTTALLDGMFRLTGGRRSMAQLLASDHDGDIERYAPGLVHNPLAKTDIIE